LEAIKPMSLNRIVKLAKATYARKEEDILIGKLYQKFA
jgi:hypothetical protein